MKTLSTLWTPTTEDEEESVETELKSFGSHLLICLKWIFLAFLMGGILGLIAAAFAISMSWVTDFRIANPLIILGLPVAGLFITFLYEKIGSDVMRGTNSVLACINSDDKVHFIMAPLIFVTSIISHAFGASVGREGAALQMGAGIGHSLGKLLKLDENDRKLLIMIGMAAAFSALFATPLAASIFAMEVISIGVMYYVALVPCLIASLTAFNLAKFLGVTYPSYADIIVPKFTPYTVSMAAVMAVIFAIFSIVICVVFAYTENGLEKWFKNPYIRVFVAGLFIILATYIVGNQDYNGLGTAIIIDAVSGKVIWYACLLKLIFTAVSLGGGYKGGEIVPTFYMGATLGCLLGLAFGLPAGFCAALGMIAVFCGVTNSPISSILIGIELFGSEGLWFFCIVIALSYMLSGYFSIHKNQIIIYSKYKTKFIHKKATR